MFFNLINFIFILAFDLLNKFQWKLISLHSEFCEFVHNLTFTDILGKVPILIYYYLSIITN